MYCPKCGKAVNEGDRFCPGCGAPMAGAADFVLVNDDADRAAAGERLPQRLDINESGWRAMRDKVNAFIEGNPFLRWFKGKFWRWEGRINPWAMFKDSLWLWLLGVGGIVLSGCVSLVSVELGALLGSILAVPVTIAQIFLGIRRCHDLNHSGLWLAVMLVPIIDVFFGLYLWFWSGTHGDNDYGPDPLMRSPD